METRHYQQLERLLIKQHEQTLKKINDLETKQKQWHLTELAKINELQNQQQNLMTKQTEMAADMKTAKDQMVKIAAESAKSLEKIDAMQKVIDDLDDVSPELQTAWDDLKAQITATDDLIPDA